jgi:hypothetical protein
VRYAVEGIFAITGASHFCCRNNFEVPESTKEEALGNLKLIDSFWIPLGSPLIALVCIFLVLPPVPPVVPTVSIPT